MSVHICLDGVWTAKEIRNRFMFFLKDFILISLHSFFNLLEEVWNWLACRKIQHVLNISELKNENKTPLLFSSHFIDFIFQKCVLLLDSKCCLVLPLVFSAPFFYPPKCQHLTTVVLRFWGRMWSGYVTAVMQNSSIFCCLMMKMLLIASVISRCCSCRWNSSFVRKCRYNIH